KKYFDDLWEVDRQKKIEREEEDRQRQYTMNKAMMATLEEQIHMLKLQAQEEERLKLEEAELMVRSPCHFPQARKRNSPAFPSLSPTDSHPPHLQRQDHATRLLQESRAALQKAHAQRAIRRDLDRFNAQKIAQRAREVAEALEMDLRIVNEFASMDETEKAARNSRKEELRKEVALYRQHLEEQKRVEAERAREVEKAYQVEGEKLWEKRTEKWKREQRARDRLMEEVIAGRQEQLRYSLDQIRIQREQTREEKAELEKQIALAEAEEERKQAERHRVALEYRDALVVQVELVEEKKREEKARAQEEGAAEEMAEVRYRQLLVQETDRAANMPR
ncbi:hypothetical protein BDK51DRAFT_33193, partial [Blyttiomyces helicus]